MKIDSDELKERIKRELPLQGVPMVNSVIIYLEKIINELEGQKGRIILRQTPNMRYRCEACKFLSKSENSEQYCCTQYGIAIFAKGQDVVFVANNPDRNGTCEYFVDKEV